ncbi:MAG TPA: zinc-binding dehydrogenase [Frankiaceae bacterium]|nr:zinc-binding dehydrogenase [Frankiaceae bacterium]
MNHPRPDTGQELRSLVTADATLELSLADVPVPVPQGTEVLIRMEAAPLNPSDLGLLLAGADLGEAVVTGTAQRPVVTAPLPALAMRGLAGRIGASLPVGNEGAGTVIAAGPSEGAQALLGRTVAVAGGAMYTQYRCVDSFLCLVLPEGTPATAGASSFVNPLTALGMVETMRREGHTALVHTAAASNLGQMLNKLCLEDSVPLVNVVRKAEQEALLRDIGAVHVVNSTAPTFMDDLIEALRTTKATLAFDAVGGGKLAGQILTAMEVAASTGEYNRYGSSTHKQVYIYGGLDHAPTVFNRNFGMAWGMGGWLLTPFLERIGLETFLALRKRVADELDSTFASTYTKQISLPEALQPEAFLAYAKQATGEKFLLTPAGTGQ